MRTLPLQKRGLQRAHARAATRQRSIPASEMSHPCPLQCSGHPMAEHCGLRDPECTELLRKSFRVNLPAFPSSEPNPVSVAFCQVLFGCFKRRLRQDVKAPQTTVDDTWHLCHGKMLRWLSLWAMCRSTRHTIMVRCLWPDTHVAPQPVNVYSLLAL